jgi:hypothetical protein
MGKTLLFLLYGKFCFKKGIGDLRCAEKTKRAGLAPTRAFGSSLTSAIKEMIASPLETISSFGLGSSTYSS